MTVVDDSMIALQRFGLPISRMICPQAYNHLAEPSSLDTLNVLGYTFEFLRLSDVHVGAVERKIGMQD